MTLDEAIERARDEALKMYQHPETKKRGNEYMQIAKWLEELKKYKAKNSDLTSGYGYYSV